MNNQNKAIPFITYQKDKGFILNQDSITFLTGIKEQLGVICVVGKYRTGKSFLVNRVILGERHGFNVGSCVNPCTKGLWLWRDTIRNSKGQACIVLDCEGFGGLDEDSNHDNKIFLFALLLGSFLVYNSQGTIDEQALSSLSLIINLAKQLKIQQGEIAFPQLLWVLRDFALQLVDANGSKMSSKDYLERALEELRGTSDQTHQKNKTRRLFKEFFKQRDCVTMVRPVEEEKQLQNLSYLDDNELRGGFINQMERVREKIRKAPMKIVQGHALTGDGLIALAQQFIQTINDGAVPNIKTAFVYVCQQENERKLAAIMKEVDQQLNQYQGESGYLMDQEGLNNLAELMKRKTKNRFKEEMMGENKEEYIEQIERECQNRLDILKGNIQKNQRERMNKEGQEQLRQLEEKVEQNEYIDRCRLEEDMKKVRDGLKSKGGLVNIEEELDYQIERLRSVYEKKEQKQREVESKQQIDKIEDRLYKIQMEIGEEGAKQALQIQLQQTQVERATLEQKVKGMEERIAIDRDSYERRSEGLERQLLIKNKELDKIKEEGREHEVVVVRLKGQLEKQQALLSQLENLKGQEVSQYKESHQRMTKQLESQSTHLTGYKHQVIQLNEQLQHIKNIQKQEIVKTEGSVQKQNSDWIVEKNYLQNQVRFLQEQMEDNKSLNQELVNALQSGIETTASNKYNVEIERLKKELKEEGEEMKKCQQYRQIVKSCISMQCRQCRNIIHANQIVRHLEECQCEFNKVQVKKTSVQVLINATMLKESSDGKTYTEYLIEVTTKDTKYSINRKYRAFCQLYQQLRHKYPALQLQSQIETILNDNQQYTNSQQINSRMKIFQKFLREIVKVPYLLENGCLRNFLDLDNQTDDVVLSEVQNLQLNNITSNISQTTNQSFIHQQTPQNQHTNNNFHFQSPSQFIHQWTNKERIINTPMSANNKENTSLISQIHTQQNVDKTYDISQEQSILGLINKENQNNSSINKNNSKNKLSVFKNVSSQKNVSGQKKNASMNSDSIRNLLGNQSMSNNRDNNSKNKSKTNIQESPLKTKLNQIYTKSPKIQTKNRSYLPPKSVNNNSKFIL